VGSWRGFGEHLSSLGGGGTGRAVPSQTGIVRHAFARTYRTVHSSVGFGSHVTITDHSSIQAAELGMPVAPVGAGCVGMCARRAVPEASDDGDPRMSRRPCPSSRSSRRRPDGGERAELRNASR
jgi:hypothetical protein